MPFSWPHEAKKYQFKLLDNLPAAPVVQIGAGLWVVCCPLCGCIHDVTGKPDGAPVVPICTHWRPYQQRRKTWQAEHPEVKDHAAIRLVYRTAIVEPFDAGKPAKKPKPRKRAA